MDKVLFREYIVCTTNFAFWNAFRAKFKGFRRILYVFCLIFGCFSRFSLLYDDFTARTLFARLRNDERLTRRNARDESVDDGGDRRIRAPPIHGYRPIGDGRVSRRQLYALSHANRERRVADIQPSVLLRTAIHATARGERATRRKQKR